VLIAESLVYIANPPVAQQNTAPEPTCGPPRRGGPSRSVATVKAYEEYEGIKQTEITRGKTTTVAQ
jgi:hypothetical protein